MAEQDLQQPHTLVDESANAGQRLRQARERLELSRADIAARTKIAERHLAAIEDERFADLASSTYAVGFSRAYARAVGLDEREIAQLVRGELDMVDGTAPPAPNFEPGDPARVPSSRTAWLAGLGVLAVIAGVFVLWEAYYAPAAPLPDLSAADATASPSGARASGPVAGNRVQQGQVVIRAKHAGVWVKVFDENGKQLFQKLMALGESYTVPADAAGPQLRTAWPDSLAITVDGRPVPPLSDKRVVLTAPISAAALLARGASVQSAAPSPSPATPAAAASPAAPARVQASPSAGPSARPPSSAASSAKAPAPAPSAKAPAPPPREHPLPQPRPSAAAPAAAPTPAPAAEPLGAAPAAPAPAVAAAALPEAAKPSTVSQ